MNTQRTTRGGRGFTQVELLVVICVLALMAALLLPALAAAKRKSSHINCVNNLKQIVLAFKMCAGDNDGKYPTEMCAKNDAMMKLFSSGNAYVLWQTMTNELNTPKILICPEDKGRTGTSSFTDGFSDANISYFFSLDADETHPQMILSGDSNLAVNGVNVRPGILNLWTNASVGWNADRVGRFHPAGNLALTDGSAAQMPATCNLATVGMTNRLVIP